MKTKVIYQALLVVTIVVLASSVLWAGNKKSPPDEDVDSLALASVLLRDKHPDRALHTLEQIDIKKPGLDLAQYYLLVGLCQLTVANPQKAYDALRSSVKNNQKEPMVYVFLAQAAFKLNRFEEVISFVAKSKGAGDALPATHLLTANAYWKLGDPRNAWSTLQRGIKKFPDNADMKRSSILVLVDAGLFLQAIEEGRSFLETDYATGDDYTIVSDAFMRGGAIEEAILILEAARLRFPDAPELTVQLARAYLKSGNDLISARLFGLASLENEAFILDAAELYRRKGQYYTALRLNERIVDQKQKIRQRMGILLETSMFEEAAALAPRLFRLGLLDEPPVRYGLAYAQFKIGDLAAAETTLSKITDTVYFTKAMELRLAIERCRADGWQCD